MKRLIQYALYQPLFTPDGLSALFGSHCMASWGMVTGTSSASDAAGRHIQPVLNGILFMMVLSKTFTKEGRHSGARTIVAPLRPNDV